MTAQIELRDIKKSFPLGETTVHALRGVNLSVAKGEFLSIVGPSGSGKTTLLNIIGCIDTPTAGELYLEGQNIAYLPDNKQTALRLFKIGFIFQTFNLIPVLTVRENVEFPLLLMNQFSVKEIQEKASALLAAVGLETHMQHRPAELSGGQRQRVAIARALVTDPAIVLADEPTANLDSETGQSILSLMTTLNHTRQTTFIFSTHDPEVLTYAKRIVRVRDGKIEAQ